MALLKDVIGSGLHADRPAAGSEGRLYYETDTDTLLRDDGTTWNAFSFGAGGGGLITSSSVLSADVTLTLSDTYYDVLTLSLAAGTWVAVANITTETNVSAMYTNAKIWDGTTVYSSQETTEGYSGSGLAMGMCLVSPPFALGSTTTIKLSVASNQAGSLVKAAMIHNAAGNTATSLVALKVA